MPPDPTLAPASMSAEELAAVTLSRHVENLDCDATVLRAAAARLASLTEERDAAQKLANLSKALLDDANAEVECAHALGKREGLEMAAKVAEDHKKNPKLHEPVKISPLASFEAKEAIREEIRAERRGEAIAADEIAAAVRALKEE
ncbi:MAG: hypothetical protein KGL39_25215 [Patescibacteria group bacterium]|nr:hypothetical protein [Patescibacteria group bacterium]